MKSLRNEFGRVPINTRWVVSALATLGVLAGSALAQPTNDNFQNAQPLSGTSGSVMGTNLTATAQVGEPSHAGQPASHSIWYVWTAPENGEVTVDTIGSTDLLGGALDTVLGVYTGTELNRLTQMAANDDFYPIFQYNNVVNGDLATSTYVTQPFNGPSGLRFNAVVGQTYYIAVDASFGGSVQLSWAYRPSGVFRFATEDWLLNLNTFAYDIPMYQCSEDESFPYVTSVSTHHTYYEYDVPGRLVTVTRVGGASGRVQVNYTTQDDSAVSFVDYIPVAGTLTFDDQEMSKTLLIEILSDFGMAQSNRQFQVVLSNPQPAPLEDGDISVPRLDPTVSSTGVVNILDMDVNPTIGLQLDTNGVVVPQTNTFNFAKANYRVPEDVGDHFGQVTIYVVRSGVADGQTDLIYRINNYRLNNRDVDEEWNNDFTLQAGSDYATPTPENAGGHPALNSDFDLAHGTITFGERDQWQPISFTINNDLLPEFNEDFLIQIFTIDDNRPVPVGLVNETVVTILFDDVDPRAGSVDEFHNADYGLDMAPEVVTSPPQLAHPGTDGIVYSLLVQPDDKTIVAGNFNSYNTVPRPCIARMNLDGSIDTSFNPGLGADQVIAALALTQTNKIIVGGSFSSFDGIQRNGVARLNADGSLDNSFAPGLGVQGAVWAVAVQPDDKVLVGGDFPTVNLSPRPNIARLHADGSLDTTFDPTVNPPNGSIQAIALDPSGKIYIGGEFTMVGSLVRQYVARLNADGSVDPTFDPDPGSDGPVYALALQEDGTLLMGGEFAEVALTPRGRIARLDPFGQVDPTFDPGLGANDTVYNITVDSDGEIYVGGLFSAFNGTRRLCFTRLFSDGSVDSGFMDTAYNQFAGVHRQYLNDLNFVLTSGVQSNGDVMIGGLFQQVGGGQFNLVTQTTDPNIWPERKARNGLRNRNNVARLLGGSTIGPGIISLLDDAYTVNEQQGFLFTAIERRDGYLGYATANFSVQPDLARSGQDYIYYDPPPIYLSSWAGDPSARMHSEGGYFGTNTMATTAFNIDYEEYYDDDVIVTLVDDSLDTGNRNAEFRLDNPAQADNFFLGGENIPLGVALGRSRAPFTIAEDDQSPGVLGYALEEFTVNENGGSAVINVVRTQGSQGAVNVKFRTLNGTAIAGTHYVPKTGTLTFLDGQTNKTFTVTVVNDFVLNADRTVNLELFNSGGGALLGASNSVLTIIDDDLQAGKLSFPTATNTVSEEAGSVVLEVRRRGGSSGTLTVQYATSDGTAQAGSEYVATNGVLTWNNGDSSSRLITVDLIHDGLTGPPSRFFTVTLTNASVPASISVGQTSTAVEILETDFYGNLQFSQPAYYVNEGGGPAIFTVTRTGGSAESVSVNYSTAPGANTAAGSNYVAAAGTLTFTNGEVAKSFMVAILDDGVTDPPPSNFWFTVSLSASSPAGLLGSPTNAMVQIVDAQTYNQPPGSPDTAFNPDLLINGPIQSLALQPDGKILAAGSFTRVNGLSRNRVARFNSNGTLDAGFLNEMIGANAPVQTLLLQSDGRVVVGGSFTTMNGVTRQRLARLATTGYLDTTFKLGSGADNTVWAAVETFAGSNRQLVVGGEFTVMNGVQRSGLARLSDTGALDGSFNPVLTGQSTVYAIAVYPTNSIQAGKIVIGGDFDSVNGVARTNLARLNPDGTLDTTFDPGDGPTAAVRALAIQLDGRLLVGGSFTNFSGQAMNHIVRLNVDGSFDPDFLVGQGANDTVQAIALQPDNCILLVGEFQRASGVTRSRITRLLPDGTVDPTINFGLGANGVINDVAVQTDGMIVIGGAFTQFDGEAHSRLVSLYGGSVSNAGRFEFTQAAYQVVENHTNAVITVRRQSGTVGETLITFATSNGTAQAGVDYVGITNTLVFPVGETFVDVYVPVINNLNYQDGNRTVNVALSDPAPPGGPTLGNQPFAVLTILNDDSAASFSSPTYARSEAAIDGKAAVTVVRLGSTLGEASVTFFTRTNGTAIPYVDYTPVTNTVLFAQGETNQNVFVELFDNAIVDGNRTVDLRLATNGMGTLLAAPSAATLTIVDDDQLPGTLSYLLPEYVANEGDGFASLTVIRTNGYSGSVSVTYFTRDITAKAGVDYPPTTNSLTFADGETNKNIVIPLLNDTTVELEKTFSVTMTNATAGAIIGGNPTATVRIQDDDIGIGFSLTNYTVIETNGTAIITVLRVGNSNSVVSVDYATTNLTAVAGQNYVAVSGTLTFLNGEVIKTITVPLLDDSAVTGDLQFGLRLSNPSPVVQLVAGGSSTVTILDNDVGVYLSSASYSVFEASNHVVISVFRTSTNAFLGAVTVNYTTVNGTAQGGVDFIPASGVLTFAVGVASNSFSVPIIQNLAVTGNRTFTVSLVSSATGAQLLNPKQAQVTIIDDDSGLMFSSAEYSVPENGVSKEITVLRTGYTNSTVSVKYAATNGTAQAGFDYLPVSATLQFGPGQLSKTFNVTVIDDTEPEDDETVLLSLFSPTGQVSVLNPAAATLTIIDNDGGLIVPAGSALISESGPTNNIIDPGERVQLWLALRDAIGDPTTNLVGTLLVTNGITAPTGPQNYGVLIPGGASVSKPFSFTANGTNGSIIKATLKLTDGTADHGLAEFQYMLGKVSGSRSNTVAIEVPAVGTTQGKAVPYPSVINVSGLPGSISSMSLTLSNITHGWSADIDTLLVGPTGAKMIPMSDAGGANAIANVTLTLTDSAAAFLPSSGKLVTGTNKPTNYLLGDAFPSPAPEGPYISEFSVFNGTIPNGEWKLYVVDDSELDSGSIAKGWKLNFSLANPVKASTDLSLTEVAVPEPVPSGDILTYTLTVTNHGPSAASSVTLTKNLPAGAQFVSATNSVGPVGTNSAGQVVATLGSMAKDDVADVTVVVRPTLVGIATSTSTVTGAESDPNSGNNSVTTLSTVEGTVSPPVLSGAYDPVQDEFVITLEGLIGETYVFERSTDLLSWIPVSTNTITGLAPGMGTTEYIDSPVAGNPQRYYRAVQQP